MIPLEEVFEPVVRTSEDFNYQGRVSLGSSDSIQPIFVLLSAPRTLFSRNHLAITHNAPGPALRLQHEHPGKTARSRNA